MAWDTLVGAYLHDGTVSWAVPESWTFLDATNSAGHGSDALVLRPEFPSPLDDAPVAVTNPETTLQELVPTSWQDGGVLKDGYGYTTSATPGPPPVEPTVPDPLIQRVVAFMGQQDNAPVVALAAEHVAVIKAMAKAYTRDVGFTDGTPNDEISAVIVTSAARLLANPEQLRGTVGTVQVLDGFSGFSLLEQVVLNRYRRRAQ